MALREVVGERVRAGFVALEDGTRQRIPIPVSEFKDLPGPGPRQPPTKPTPDGKTYVLHSASTGPAFDAPDGLLGPGDVAALGAHTLITLPNGYECRMPTASLTISGEAETLAIEGVPTGLTVEDGEITLTDFEAVYAAC